MFWKLVLNCKQSVNSGTLLSSFSILYPLQLYNLYSLCNFLLLNCHHILYGSGCRKMRVRMIMRVNVRMTAREETGKPIRLTDEWFGPGSRGRVVMGWSQGRSEGGEGRPARPVEVQYILQLHIRHQVTRHDYHVLHAPLPARWSTQDFIIFAEGNQMLFIHSLPLIHTCYLL